MSEEKIHYYLEYVIGLLLIVIVVLGILGFKKNMESENEEGVSNEVVLNENNVNVSESDEDVVVEQVVENTKRYHVDVKGAVKNAGVYELEEGSMVIDAINLAGGLNNNASTQYVNLAYPVDEAMVIYIYTKNEVKNMNNPTENVCNCPTIDTSTCKDSSIIINSSEKKESSSDTSTKDETVSSKVSINTGTLEELMTLSGIGEAKAKAIIEYRTNNGLFQKLEDIMNVSGIGESAYQKIKDYITL